MDVTIYDIAERASVSIATVSRVLNNSTRVAEATRQRVLEIADELGYEPHTSAQNLARRQSNLIAVVLPWATNFFLEVLRGVQDRVAETSYDVLVYLARNNKEVESRLDRALKKGRAAGVLFLSNPVTDAFCEKLKNSSATVVLADTYHDEFESAVVDNVLGGYVATNHLIETGCRSVGLIMASPRSVPSADRRRGYVKALTDAGIAVDEDLISFDAEAGDGYTEDSGYRTMCELLSRPRRPDGVFVTSDEQAIGVLRAMREHGLAVPDDISVVGFDDIPLLRYAGLSTLRQPMYELGRFATERLIKKLESGDGESQHTVFAPELIVRETTRQAVAAVAAEEEE
ncbi:MAG: LacI family DNA-binding transcriptional regulator [Bacteroidetes bacterium]|nr:LacI family DNA-binding transcriptional regulator [Bacteroidota bacterium]